MLVSVGSYSLGLLSSFELALQGAVLLQGVVIDAKQLLLALATILPLLIGGLAYLLRMERRRIKDHYEQRVGSIQRHFESDVQQLREEATENGENSRTVISLRKQVEDLARERDDIRTKNPRFRKLTFNVGVIGIVGSGKTGLCLRLTDPLFKDINGTAPSNHEIDYDCSVVVVTNKRDSSRFEYVFRFREWGGEKLIEAQSDMLRYCDPARPTDVEGASVARGMQALVFVVDLAGPAIPVPGREPVDRRGHIFNRERIRAQIERYFDQRSLRFLLNQTIQTHLQTVVLFINKADTLPGGPEKAEEDAKAHYQDLIVNLGGIYSKLHVIVGSVNTDAGLLKLYSHLVESILPAEVKKQRPLGRSLEPDVRGAEGFPGDVGALADGILSSLGAEPVTAVKDVNRDMN